MPTLPNIAVRNESALSSDRTAWVLDGRDVFRSQQSAPMARELGISKLSDEFGQYTLVLKCSVCGHERAAEPQTLARLCGWDTRLEDMAKRMRCSKCGKKSAV